MSEAVIIVDVNQIVCIEDDIVYSANSKSRLAVLK